MNELARAAGILFQAHLWRIFRTRRALVAIGLTGLPVVLAGIVRLALRFHDEIDALWDELPAWVKEMQP